MPLNWKQICKWAMLSVYSLFLCSVTSSCGGTKDKADIAIDFIPIQQDKNGAWSLISTDGSIKFDNAFESEPTVVISGLFSVKGEKGYALYRIEDDKFKLVNGLDGLTYVGSPNCGLLPICCAEERITVINLQGEAQFKLEPVNGKEIVSCSYHFEDDMLGVVDEDNKFGFFNKQGHCVISPIYDMAGPFSEGKAVVQKDSLWIVIDKGGNKLFSIKSGQTPVCDWKFKYGRLCTRDANGHQFYVYNDKGEMSKLPETVYAIDDFNETYLIYRPGEEGSWGMWEAKKKRGIMTFAGESIISPAYEYLCFGEDDMLLSSRDGKEWQLMYYSETKRPKDIDYTDVQYISGFGYVANDYKYAGADRENMYILNKDGEVYTRQNPFKSYGNRWWLGDDKSQFIPKDRIIDTFAGLITPNGVGEYVFGAVEDDKMKAIKKSRDFENTPWIPIGPISIGNNQIHGNVWEENGKIEHFSMWVNTPCCWGKNGVAQVVEGFSKTGFTETHRKDRPEACMVIMEKDGVQIIVEYSIANKESINIDLYKGLPKSTINRMLDEFDWICYDESATIEY